jgi:hypothetical protein
MLGVETSKLLAEAKRMTQGSSSEKSAHVRRAHWHGYWVGKGRKDYRLNWVHPMLVGRRSDDEAGGLTISNCVLQ